jgi:hypothetical protein
MIFSLFFKGAIRRLRQVLRAKNAYIVPSVIGPDEKKLCVLLKIPILSAHPEISQALSTKSGSKRIFSAASVNVPPGANDLFEIEDTIRSLARLIAMNVDIPRWIFKIENEFGGRGTAYYDVSHLSIISELRRERDILVSKDEQYWRSIDVQESVKERILYVLGPSLRKNLVIALPECYRGWEAYMRAFSKVGGLIEAAPSDVRGNSSVQMLIEPSGSIKCVCTFEESFGKPYVYCGSSFPAVSAPHDSLIGASRSICNVLKEQGVIGYVNIDFVTFWDHINQGNRLWAVDLKLNITTATCNFFLFHMLMNGRYSDDDGNYYVNKPKRSFRKIAMESSSTMDTPGSLGAPSLNSVSDAFVPISGALAEKRFFVIHEYIHHPNLGTIRHQSFFNICRMKGVSFDVIERTGTIFALIDSIACGTIGMMTIGRTKKESLKTMWSGLSFVKEQVGLNPITSDFTVEESNFKNIFYMTKKLKDEIEKL